MMLQENKQDHHDKKKSNVIVIIHSGHILFVSHIYQSDQIVEVLM
jgi:hypothetical protein